MKNGQFSIPPGLNEVLDLHKKEIFNTLRVSMPGIITSYDPTKATAEIQPVYNRVYNTGKVVPLPVLQDCPVFTLQGGGAHMRFPIEPGDECLVIFADANIDAWFATGNIQTPYDNRRHNLSDGFAIVGVNSLANLLTTFLLPAEAGLADTTSKVAIMGGKITMANTVTTLLLVINGLIDVLKALQIQGPGVYPLTTASIAALEAYKLQVEALLY